MKVNTWQRVMLATIVGQSKGNVNYMRRAIKAAEVLELTDAEKEKVGFIQLPNGNVQWADMVLEWELEMMPDVLSLVKKAFSAFKEWPAAQAAQVIRLADALGIDE